MEHYLQLPINSWDRFGEVTHLFPKVSLFVVHNTILFVAILQKFAKENVDAFGVSLSEDYKHQYGLDFGASY
jgi:hypothetical protein